MSWKSNSIIGFDDPSLLKSLEINSPEDVVKIKDIFQGFKQVSNSTNQILKKILSGIGPDQLYIDQDYGNTFIYGGDLEKEDNNFFIKEDECNFTNSIIRNHSNLLGIQNDYKKTEIMHSIIQEILITVQMFSEKIILNFDLTMLEYIKYIINTIIGELRKNPYLTTDENEGEAELTAMGYYFSEIGKFIDEIVVNVNNDKIQEDIILGEDNKLDLLEMIYKRRDFYLTQRGQLKEYYEMCIDQYIIILQSIIIYGNGYLPGLYQKLCDLVSTKLALDILDEYYNSQQE